MALRFGLFLLFLLFVLFLLFGGFSLLAVGEEAVAGGAESWFEHFLNYIMFGL